MQDQRIQIYEISCNARPDHTLGSYAGIQRTRLTRRRLVSYTSESGQI
jgi:hypothetical protein